MRRFVLLAVSIMAVVSLAVSPVFAVDWDGDGCDEDWFDCSGFDERFFIDDPVLFDQACSPGLPDGVFIDGCLFSDSSDDHDDDHDDFHHDDDDFRHWDDPEDHW